MRITENCTLQVFFKGGVKNQWEMKKWLKIGKVNKLRGGGFRGGGRFFFWKSIPFLMFLSLVSFNKSCIEMPQNNPLSQNGPKRFFSWETFLNLVELYPFVRIHHRLCDIIFKFTHFLTSFWYFIYCFRKKALYFKRGYQNTSSDEKTKKSYTLRWDKILSKKDGIGG